MERKIPLIISLMKSHMVCYKNKYKMYHEKLSLEPFKNNKRMAVITTNLVESMACLNYKSRIKGKWQVCNLSNAIGYIRH